MNEQWWEDKSIYVSDETLPLDFSYNKLSLIKIYPNGLTQPGWGAKDFMGNYLQAKFLPEKALQFYMRTNNAFGIVMRSVPMICVDIDGKNGGIETARILGLTPTLAETSKSGNGFHLFYEMPETAWHPELGYSEFPDVIGLVPGVDIRGTGIVYHFPQQRWNQQRAAILPPKLAELIGRVRDVKHIARLNRDGAAAMDDDELVIVHDNLSDQLKGQFVSGNRNNKLFAIGAQMCATNYPDWQQAVYDRGLEIGLEESELTDMIKNIDTYA